MILLVQIIYREHNGSVVECLTAARPRVREFEHYQRHCVVDLEQDTFFSTGTRPYLTDRLFMGRKESNQKKKKNSFFLNPYQAWFVYVQ